MQWRTFVMLDLYGKATIARIARDTEFDKGLLSQTVKTLVEKELILTIPSESDRRQHNLSMTSKGRSMFEKAFAPMRQRQNKLLNALSTEERETLFNTFEKIEKSVDDMRESE
jgi:DNA-binding MarR family transcriptional regulator